MNLQQQYAAFRTILVKEILRFMRIWVQTVVPAGITTALYFVIFGELIGSQISDIAGFTYMDYIVPGIILMTVINNAYANVVSSFYGAKFQRHVEEMLVSPMPNYLIIIGFVAGGVARGMIVGTVVTFIAMFFTDFQVHDYLVAISVVVLTAILFSLGGFINAIYANSFDDISIIPTFVLTPLTYLGGIFYSIDMLPAFWQDVSLVNPILYMINAFRYGMLGISDIPMSTAFGIIILFTAGLYVFCLYLLKKGIGIRS
ncbi:MAG: ABC transporter permease [Thioalkalispiraceae bacterium]|jgi:ABC-2 type transport system permease protein